MQKPKRRRRPYKYLYDLATSDYTMQDYKGLNEAETEWLLKFNQEFYEASFENGPLHTGDLKKKAMDDDNARRRCLYAINNNSNKFMENTSLYELSNNDIDERTTYKKKYNIFGIKRLEHEIKYSNRYDEDILNDYLEENAEFLSKTNNIKEIKYLLNDFFFSLLKYKKIQTKNRIS